MAETTIYAEDLTAAAELMESLANQVANGETEGKKITALRKLHGAEAMLNALGFDWNLNDDLTATIYHVED